MKLQYHSLARKEVIAAAKHYERQLAELGSEFLDEMDRAEVAIAGDPLLFEQVRIGVRRYLLDRFPYGVYYRMPDANSVRIIAVRHHSRRPGPGMRRA